MEEIGLEKVKVTAETD